MRNRIFAIFMTLTMLWSLVATSVPAYALQSGGAALNTAAELVRHTGAEIQSVKKTIELADGTQYTVIVTYHNDAEIPLDAELSVTALNRRPENADENKGRPVAGERLLSEQEWNGRSAAVAKALHAEEDYVFFTQLLDVALMENGQEIQPKAPVEVTIETDAVDVSRSDSIALARFDVQDKAEAVETENRSGESGANEKTKDWARFVFSTDRFGEFGLAGAAKKLHTWTAQGVELSVLGPADMKAKIKKAQMAQPEEGVSLIEAFSVDVTPAAGHDVALWLTAEQKSEDRGAIVGCRLQGSELGEPFLEGEGTDTPAPILAGEKVALLWDTGCRAVTLELEDVTLEGVLPEDATAEAVDVSEKYDDPAAIADKADNFTPDDVEGVSVVAAYDITVEHENEVYQPGEDSPVTVTIANEGITAGQKLEVWHILDDGSVEVITDVTVEDGSVSFQATGFSVYVVVESVSVPEPGGDAPTGSGQPQCTFKFFVKNPDTGIYTEYQFTDDQGKTVNSQTIKNGNELTVPQLTSMANEIFAGWYEGVPNGQGGITLAETPYDFDNITITENSEVHLYAVYKPFVTVTFHDQYDAASNTFPVAHTRRAALVTEGEGENTTTSAKVKISDLSTTYTSSNGTKMVFQGWSYTHITTPGAAKDDNGNDVAAITPDENGCITVSADTDLYPIYKLVHRLSFYTGPTGSGAPYIPSAAYGNDDGPTSLEVPEWEGYTFQGWYVGTLTQTTVEGETVDTINYGGKIAEADGSLVQLVDDGGVYVSDGKLMLHSDATLYAQWSDRSVSYKIIIWKQKTTDGANAEKTYDFVESISKTAAPGATVSVDNEYTSRNYPGYHFADCSSATTVNDSGYTVLHVYYDRNEGQYTPSGKSHTLKFLDSTNLERVFANSSVAYDTSLDGSSYVPADPKSATKGYSDNQVFSFSGWFADPLCSTQVFFSKKDYDGYQGYNQKVLYDTMPDEDLTIYAGWTADWFIVQIDPNYGTFNGTGGTWFWETFDGERVKEYTQVTRDYVESSSGTYYYVKHDRAYYGYTGNEWDNRETDRETRYTDRPSEATEDKTFEYAPGVYTYAGWYEVKPDGTEVPYDFSRQVDHDIYLKLHWKKNGTYYIAYDAKNGTLDQGESGKPLGVGYADYANIVLTRSANAPEKYTFVGWQVRGSDDKRIYTPGQTFTLHADDALRIGGKEIVYLDAVYVQVGTASIIYDANGGTVISENLDYGSIPSSTGDAPTPLSGSVNDGKVTVSGLTNNSRINLSSGAGFIKDGARFMGWSDKPVCDSTAKFYPQNSTTENYAVDNKEPVTLYAVWGVQATYYLNNTSAEWGGSWAGYGTETVNSETVHTKTVYLGNPVSEPTDIPTYTSEGQMFRYWTTNQNSGAEPDPYDFTQPVTGALDLYAYWSGGITVPVHAVDASASVLEEKTADSNWTVNNLQAGTEEIALPGTGFVTAPENGNYELAFVAAATNLQSISESKAVTAVKYDSAKKTVCVKYKDAEDYAVLGSGCELYFVYYQKKTLNIGYQSMGTGGTNPVNVSDSAPKTTGLIGGTTEYNVAESVIAPLEWANNNTYSYYAYAVGDANGGMRVITDVSNSDSDRPTLRIRNTWRGFQYTTDHGEDASWMDCGYAPDLYVIYYERQPRTITIQEKTLGASNEVENQAFIYHIKIKEGDTVAQEFPEVSLKNGESRTVTAYYWEDGDTQHSQTVTVTQEKNENFVTEINDVVPESEPYQWEYTTSSVPESSTVIFTNTSNMPKTVEVHVALAGEGNIQLKDDLRNDEHSITLSMNERKELLTTLSPNALFKGDFDVYAFGAVVYGSDENGVVTIDKMNIGSVSYEQVNGVYDLVLRDSDGAEIGKMGSGKLYYLYYPMPKIRYVKESDDGDLSPITGSMTDVTNPGSFVSCDDISYNHSPLWMNGKKVVQDETFEIPQTGFVISQSGNNFRMPPVLDDGLNERYLSYARIGAGANVTSIGALEGHVSDSRTMHLQVKDNALQYSFDGSTWNDLPLSGSPTIYAIYTERGYDLQISKAVDTSESGPVPSYITDASFTVTISSDAITKGSYEAEGAEAAAVSATPAQGDKPGSITLTVKDGSKIKLKGMGQGTYTITETGNEDYNLTAKTGKIVGGATTDLQVQGNNKVSLTLNTETKVELTNSPAPLCKIMEDDTPHIFYTLRSAIQYVDETSSSKTGTIEMLRNYSMPAEDTVEIPSDFHITLTTDSESGKAVIKRSAALTGVPLFTNNGELTFSNIDLDGASVEAAAPYIQSAGDLTIEAGATVRNAKNSGNGGAINATAGNITVGGTISGSSALSGGAIYHSGNGTITVSGEGKLQDNTATDGNGGAIWAESGTIQLTGTSSLSGNKAEKGNGGAIYAVNAEIDIDQSSLDSYSHPVNNITGNTAKSGGAIYVETGTIKISTPEGDGGGQPKIQNNTATDGDGGAIWVGNGSVSVAGGSLSGNKAENGNGGAIYANGASVAVSSGEFMTNRAKNGGAVYAESGAVNVTGATFGGTDEDKGNKAENGNGGAIYAGSGNVTLSGDTSVTQNTAGQNGGAVYAGSGNVTLSDTTSVTQNTAGQNGGAVYAGTGTVSVSCTSVSQNTATVGKGGAIYAGDGAVMVDGTTLNKNTAGSDGGAVYAGTGAVNVTDATFGGTNEDDGNTAGQNGGAIYAGSGNVTLSGDTSVTQNTAGQNGGAIYAGSGNVTLSNTTSVTQNTAGQNGGALYADSGAVTLETVTATGNSAKNGAAIFVNTGRATFSAGSYTNNTASNGGAVSVGSVNARLYFNGNVQIKDNTLGTASDAPKSNVYLDQDDDAVINIDTLGTDASIGIYVADSVENTRGVPGARFAIYTSNDNVAKITNDRYASLTVQSDTAAKKLYWGNSIKVSVHKLDSYGSGFTQPASSGAGTQLGKYDTYYPEFSDAALSELASELVVKNNLNIGTKVYAAAYLDGVRSFGDYITKLTWDKEASDWYVTTRSGDKVYLKKTDGTGYHRIYIYYAEPAYLSIENNTDIALTISGMMVDGISVINSNTVAGYGMVFAKNGAIRSALLPVTAEDLQLSAGQSINLLIPGGQNKAYTLDGGFETTTGGEVRLRRGAETSLSEEMVTVSATDGTFEQLTGTTLNAAGTYNIIFGSNKIICKVVDAGGVEHPYSKISDAITDIVATTGTNPPYTLATAKTATIEMVTDYLLTASDDVNIPQGFDITLTTAAKTGATYCYDGTGDRATISRDTQNTDSMIKGWNSLANNKVVTTLRLNNLIFDGKSVRGASDGGAVATQYVNVYIDTVDFKNVYASNGGALLVMFNFDRVTTKNTKHTVADTILEVKNSDFTGCTSTTTVTSNRLGGGAIVTNAETMTLEGCDFTNCTAVDQAGAVFHRIDFNDNSWTNVTDCTFTNCSADAAGGLEIDSKTITVTGCTFEHCVAKKRNGGGFNVWALNVQNGLPTEDCWVTVRGCTFNDCQLTTTDTSRGNGGGFRSNAVYNTIVDCTFTNNTAIYGGGISLSNTNAKADIIRGCSFERCTATGNGGGVYSRAKALTIEDYISGDITRHTEVKNCSSKNDGAGIYANNTNSTTTFAMTNATISGNRTTASGKNGGGVYTNARTVTISGSTITDNTCTSLGGGVYANTYTSLSIADSDISRNIASGNGGGVWFDVNDDNVRKNMTLTVKGSTIDGNTSGGSGGGIYTLAKAVTIQESESKTDNSGNRVRSSISNNTANTNGGGVYQSRNVDGSKLEISNTSINGNTANCATNKEDNGGGGIYAGVRTLNITKSTVSNNTAKIHGGGILFEINNNDARNAMSLTVAGCTLSGNTSNGNGGGIYTRAKTVVISDYKEGTGASAVVTPSVISNCTTTWSGGGIYQNRGDIEGSKLEISNTTISGCVSNDASTDTNPPRGGGGIFANVRNVTVTGSTISNNRAVRNGGGIDAPLNGNGFALVIDDAKITGNSAGNQGGGVYTRSQLTLRNKTEITGNRLTTNTVDNAAGVYILNERTLYVGPENAAYNDTDTINVKDNTTANGTASNLRLWSNNNGENNQASVYVYCSLSGEIRVVNANKVGTWFGSSKHANPNGFTDDYAVFKADHSTLHGIIDRTDETGRKIIWAGPPIAKITDRDGKLLYLKTVTDENGTRGTSPAIFDRLGTGTEQYSTVAAFNMLCSEAPELYTAGGELYNGNTYYIKMLDSFETDADMNVLYYAGRTVTFTTASKNDTDNYPYRGSGTRATVVRGSGVGANRSLLNAKGSLNLENIVIDGGSLNGITPGGSTRCMYVDNSNAKVVLGTNALLQNGNTTGNGGGVYVNNGNFELQGGVIRSCTADNGGGVYKYDDNTFNSFTFSAGQIVNCVAHTSGGGVNLNKGTFHMTGGTISGCSATYGGGVFIVHATARPMYMSGGSIVNNHATTKGGGIAFEGENSRLYFSGKVNVSGNTCDSSLAANKTCNVQLDWNSKEVINTNNGGLLPGSYIGVYVPGNRNDQHPENDGTPYKERGGQKDAFGTFANNDRTSTFYCFVNDRNGLKGGIIEDPAPNTIYWIQIFSLTVSKQVDYNAANPPDPNEEFSFTVNIWGNASVSGQLNAGQIDNESGDFGEMNLRPVVGLNETSATFTLKANESITAVNLSEGLNYSVTENLTPDQAKKYAVTPAATQISRIGENKNRIDVDPYVSKVKFSNLLPVCKITDNAGNLLYWKDTVNGKQYVIPAVYTELTGKSGAFKALQGTLYSANSTASYSVSNGVKIQMLVQDYTLTESIKLPASVQGSVTLTTAGRNDSQFPYRGDSNELATIKRGFSSETSLSLSMISVGGDLTLSNITLDGQKTNYTCASNGGIVNVPNGGKLTITDGATLQNSKTSLNGGAVYVASGGVVTMNGGKVWKNVSDGDGGGIYLEQVSTLKLSGNPDFGTGNNKNYTTKNNSITNGGKFYPNANQDIFIAGYEGKDVPVASLLVSGKITANSGSIWVWAEKDPHFKANEQFAQFDSGVRTAMEQYDSANGTKTLENTLKAFHNAQDDRVTFCGGDTYLTGNTGDEEGWIYWTGGFDIQFKKIDGFGNALPGAEFTLYKDVALTDQTNYKVTSSDGGSEFPDPNNPGSNLPVGTVQFEKIPAGVYYMKETAAPEMKDSNGNVIMSYKNENVYIVLVGDSALQNVGSGVLADITAQNVTDQIGSGADQKDAAVFLIDKETGKAVATPDIAKYGIMNVATVERKVILRKTEKQTFIPLEGAEFIIYNVDGSEYATTSESSANGCFFIDTMPVGTYRMVEKKPPTKKDGEATTSYVQNEGKTFILTIKTTGEITLTEDTTTDDTA